MTINPNQRQTNEEGRTINPEDYPADDVMLELEAFTAGEKALIAPEEPTDAPPQPDGDEEIPSEPFGGPIDPVKKPVPLTGGPIDPVKEPDPEPVSTGGH